MSLSPGSRLGPYDIVALLGVGGMGEVYRARDTRLERTVAIKVLHGAQAADPARRQRFEREARAVASLSDPHICHLNDVGHQDGVDYLVMEYLEGETLADRLGKGPLPLALALRYAVEIASALASAHRQGVVHRDLKPGNVMLTKSGAKLLDFGLARTAKPVLTSDDDLSALATRDKPLTGKGTILGTVQYMAPEQIEGREADARTDLWGLGALLYEMVTGKRAFVANSPASLIGAILKDEPRPIRELKPLTPPSLERLVKTCLAKEPDERWQNARDLARELQFLAEGGDQAGSIAPARTRLQGLAIPIAAVALLACLGMLPIVFSHLRESTTAPEPVRFSLAPPDGVEIRDSLAISPDGRHVAFLGASRQGETSLYLRSLDSLEARPLAGTAEAASAFWSPDSRALGFAARGELKAIDVSSGVMRTLASVPSRILGAAWGREGVLLVATDGPLLRVSAAGGVPSPATSLDIPARETAHRFPQFLPDGRHFLYQAIVGPLEVRGTYVGSLDSSKPRRVMDGRTHVQFAAPRHLLFPREAGLMAQSFDPKTLEVTGEPVLIASSAEVPLVLHGLRPSLGASSTGTLTYVTPSLARRLTWLDRQGRRLGSIGAPANYSYVELSPDDRRVLVEITDARGRPDIWVLDALRGTPSRLTFESRDYNPIWSPDGRSIVFTSNRDGPEDLYRKPADGSGADSLLVRSHLAKHPSDWSPDGRLVVYDYHSATRAQDVWIVSADGSGEPKPFLEGAGDESQAQFSPDGRWLAYRSQESGRAEVFVRAFPGPGGQWLVSPDGGSAPRWRRDGKELFYVAADRKLMAVAIETSTSFEASAPTPLFPTDIPHTGGPYLYDVAADGQRFLLRTPDESHRPSITVVLNWPAALGRN